VRCGENMERRPQRFGSPALKACNKRREYSNQIEGTDSLKQRQLQDRVKARDREHSQPMLLM